MYKKISALFLFSIILTSSSLTLAQNLSPEEKEWLKKSFRIEKNGWIFLHMEGEPFERGFQRGFLAHTEIKDFLNTLTYIVRFETAKEIDFFIDKANELFGSKVSDEYNIEMKGMVSGMEKTGGKITFEEMLFLNGFIDIYWYWWNKEKHSHGPGCSAFIATGDATSDGEIVMAHNTWFDYYIAPFCNFIIEIVPDQGHRILMQSWAPFIYSGTDFFITEAGLIGTETTIGGFEGFNDKKSPVFERARKAMQYANNIDEWVQIMVNKNNGAYANSWLLGNIKTGEIARFELGLNHHSLEKKKNGYFTGSNITENIDILRNETKAKYDDIRKGNVARRVRWNQLMKKYFGKIDLHIAKEMLADHHDAYLDKENPCIRTICGHGELDDGKFPGISKPYKPGGAFDGKVIDSDLAREWKFWAKWGSPCGIGFEVKNFLEKHSQYDWLENYLKDIPAQPWTIFPINIEILGGENR